MKVAIEDYQPRSHQEDFGEEHVTQPAVQQKAEQESHRQARTASGLLVRATQRPMRLLDASENERTAVEHPVSSK